MAKVEFRRSISSSSPPTSIANISRAEFSAGSSVLSNNPARKKNSFLDINARAMITPDFVLCTFREIAVVFVRIQRMLSDKSVKLGPRAIFHRFG